LKSESLNLLEPSGPVQASNGIDLSFTADMFGGKTGRKETTWEDPGIYRRVILK
jgi:hypothetical protein